MNDSFLKSDREKWRAFIRQNTKRNENGDAVISKDDSWFYEDVWDEDYKELIARDGNPTPRSILNEGYVPSPTR